MTRNSVLYTQDILLPLQAEQRQLEARLREVTAKVEEAIQKHREQIAKSLLSKDETERKLAEGIATWWDVPISSPSQR